MRLPATRAWMTTILLGLCVAVFLGQSLLSARALTGFQVLFGLSWEGLQQGYWWQFLTYAFLHGNILHLILNMVGLWFAGRMVERIIGPWRLLLLYIFAAVLGGILQMMLAKGDVLLLGASASVCGIVLDFTTMLPEAELIVLLFFVIPLRVRAKFLGWALAGSSLLFLVLRFETWISHAAHLGGCIAGFLFARISGYAAPAMVERWFLRLIGRSHKA